MIAENNVHIIDQTLVSRRNNKFAIRFNYKILIVFAIFAIGALLLRISFFKTKPVSGINKVVSKNISVDRSFNFSAFNNQGKQATSKIKLKIASVDKTNTVLVKDQSYTAKNNKTFLIVNLELKNDASSPLNIIPGDLVRIAINNDEESKFAPDLHNNTVTVAGISTKLDRLGFVIPEETKNIKIYVGELDGKKEEINISFPS
jgi:hypothetical protein